ncbi:MAG TPA: ATP-binding protein [Acidobacteriota bacterium]|nr:ATP-binding protein [Acidobacteriota bacterium]
MIARYLEAQILKDLGRKMVFVSGPRQAGKTTLAQTILRSQYAPAESGRRYLNWDDSSDREMIFRGESPFPPGLVVFDEIHKYARWRRYLKGLYDKRKEELRVLVTGSARLDYYRRGGDSLQGRYHHLRLHPLSLREVLSSREDAFTALLDLGGFPEPFLSGSADEARRWSREYRSRVLREDIADLERVSELSLLERLAVRLPDLVGSPLSLNALRADLEVAHQTVRRWVEILERIYQIFRIHPFGAPSIRAVKKEAKHYQFDWTLVRDRGARFENLVACHLQKENHYLEDTRGIGRELRYFRDVENREVDFVVLEDSRPILFVECKLSGRDLSPSLRYLHSKFPAVRAIQVTAAGDIDIMTRDGIRICDAPRFLSELAV